jgi:hypothetical protein
MLVDMLQLLEALVFGRQADRDGEIPFNHKEDLSPKPQGKSRKKPTPQMQIRASLELSVVRKVWPAAPAEKVGCPLSPSAEFFHDGTDFGRKVLALA